MIILIMIIITITRTGGRRTCPRETAESLGKEDGAAAAARRLRDRIIAHRHRAAPTAKICIKRIRDAGEGEKRTLIPVAKPPPPPLPHQYYSPGHPAPRGRDPEREKGENGIIQRRRRQQQPGYSVYKHTRARVRETAAAAAVRTTKTVLIIIIIIGSCCCLH